MVTTIQVSRETAEMLKRLKKRTGAASYDEAIQKFVKRHAMKSMAGALAGKKKYTVKEIMQGLRDKHDRF